MVRTLIALAACAFAGFAAAKPRLDLGGYIDRDGAVSVQRAGDTVDPYFALQAFLLAHEQGLDAREDARRWAAWLLPRQKPDATFDRFCRRGPVWAPCKTADADDALLAMWMHFLRTFGDGLAGREASHDAARATLERLRDPARGIYLVSPVYQHGLLIDNLEVWAAGARRDPALARAIQQAFWDPRERRYLVSTQPGQRDVAPRFYPDAVAQIFPLAVAFPHVPGGRAAHYRAWIGAHRAEWLRQAPHDFAWGLIALVALREGDRESAACWVRETQALRHGAHWTVTDEVARQALAAQRVQPAPAEADCS